MSQARRHLLAAALAATCFAAAAPAWAQAKIKVAAIYTVPVEQQWVSRIDKALKSAVARGEIDIYAGAGSRQSYERLRADPQAFERTNIDRWFPPGKSG